MNKVRHIDHETRDRAIGYLEEILEKFKSGELQAYSLVARYADNSMHSAHSKSVDLFDDLALASYLVYRVQRRIEERND